LSELNQELNQKLSLADSNKRDEISASESSSIDNTNHDISDAIHQLKKVWLQLHLQSLSLSQQNEIETLVGGSDVLHENCKLKQNKLLQQILELQQQQSKKFHQTTELASSSGGNFSSIRRLESTDEVDILSVREELRNVTAAAHVTETAHTAQIEALKQV